MRGWQTCGVFLLLGVPAVVHGDTLTVPGQYASISAAVDAADDGDEIVLAPAVYIGASNRGVLFHGKEITIRSSNPDDPLVVAATVVDLQNLGPAFYFAHNEGPLSVVDGLTIRNGMTIYDGGAIHCSHGAPTIRRCTFLQCMAEEDGGAIYIRQMKPDLFLRVDRCTFLGNQADEGGAIRIASSSSHGFANVVISNSLFSGNCASKGGAASVAARNGTIRWINCTFANNESTTSGSVLRWSVLPGGDYTDFAVANCIFAQGGARVQPAIYVSGTTVAISHSIMPLGMDDVEVSSSGGAIVWGPGIIELDPLLADPLGVDDESGTLDDDLHLSSGSPAIEAGAEIGIAWSNQDLDGEPRHVDILSIANQGSTYRDIGADEYVTDCNGNGIDDIRDIAAGTSMDCSLDLVPDECQPDTDCNRNGVRDICDIAGGVADCDNDGIPDECAPQADCNFNGVLDLCDLAQGSSSDCDGNGVPDECQEDCNGNGVHDDCDLAFALELDCNANDVPDTCDAAQGEDCNDNFVPDECEPDNDCNDNGVSDICDIAENPELDINENGILDPCDECLSVADCADVDGDGIRDDNCVFWTCDLGECFGQDVPFGDMAGQFGGCAPDGTADGNDRFMALGCFAASWPNQACEDDPPFAMNVDAGGPFGSCLADGVCDANDAFHALNAFSGASTCSCAPGAPQPGGSGPVVVATAQLVMAPASTRIRPGAQVAVDVLLDGPLADLRGYQLHVAASGGTDGILEVVDIAVDDARDHVFADVSDWRAFNVHTRQMLAGIDADGIHTRGRTYLATFVFEASVDAAGTFVIELLSDEADPAQRSFLFPTAPGDTIRIAPGSRAVVEVTDAVWSAPGASPPLRVGAGRDHARGWSR